MAETEVAMTRNASPGSRDSGSKSNSLERLCSDLGPKKWYDEIPPRYYQNIQEMREAHLPALAETWRYEISCEDLDVAQRRILRDARMARVYFNTAHIPISPSKPAQEKHRVEKRRAYSSAERASLKTRASQRVQRTFYTYGVPYKKTSTVPSSNKTSCDRYSFIPPYSGPYAVHLWPGEVINRKYDKEHYQVVNKNYEAYPLPAGTSEALKKYQTTPVSVWKQQRFAAPEGFDYREVKELMRAAKYRALLATVEQNTGPDDLVALAPGRYVSSHHPDFTIIRDDEIDYDGVDETGKEKKKPVFNISDMYLEDLMEKTERIRQRLAPHILPQPKENFYPDPRKFPAYLERCDGNRYGFRQRSSSVGATLPRPTKASLGRLRTQGRWRPCAPTTKNRLRSVRPSADVVGDSSRRKQQFRP